MPFDVDYARRRLPGRVVSYFPTMDSTMPEAARLAAAGCGPGTVVVANDSGPMHLAAAVKTPVVALFGPTDPGRTGPTGVRHDVLDRYVFCSPCYLKECPYGHECMREIGVEAVAAAVERVCGAPPDF